jgi:SAM-dependent methyltransferase
MDPAGGLEELAAAAEMHARREHGAEIGGDDAALADRILRAEAARADPARFESLAASYGAWLGRLAARRWNALWVGLSEPAPPRLRVGGVLVSPFDAVRRRLADPQAPSLEEILRRLEPWARVPSDPAALNREAWNRLEGEERFAGTPELPEDPEAALDEWIRKEGIRGKELLCLGAGGGRHGPLHALAGARVTVVDLSERQLEHDRRAAAARGLALRTVRASIDALAELGASAFDVVLQPVSSCYVPDVERVYAEVARVIRPGGLYVVQHKQPASLQASDGPPYGLVHPQIEGRPLPPAQGAHREPGTAEFLHGLEALLGGLCRAGFAIEDVAEPPRADALAPAGSPGHRAWFLPPYLKIKARRHL